MLAERIPENVSPGYNPNQLSSGQHWHTDNALVREDLHHTVHRCLGVHLDEPSRHHICGAYAVEVHPLRSSNDVEPLNGLSVYTQYWATPFACCH